MRIKSRFIVFVFLLLCGLLISRMGHAFDVGNWTSSNTATADSTVTLCGQFTIAQGTNNIVVPAQASIHAIIVSSAIASSQIQLYDSSWTVVSATSSLTIGPIMTSSLGEYVYDTVFRHGLNYVKSGTAIVQILYTCF